MFPSTVPCRDWYQCYRFLISLLPLVCGYFLWGFFFSCFFSIQFGYSLSFCITKFDAIQFVHGALFFIEMRRIFFCWFFFIYLSGKLAVVNIVHNGLFQRIFHFDCFLHNFSWLLCKCSLVIIGLFFWFSFIIFVFISTVL